MHRNIAPRITEGGEEHCPVRLERSGHRKRVGKAKDLNIGILILKILTKLMFKWHGCRSLLEKKLMLEAIMHDLAELFHKSEFCGTF